MPTKISAIEASVRANPLIETTAKFWTSAELTELIIRGIKDLWRDIVDLKQEHFLTINPTDVTLPADSDQLQGVPLDVHKIYLLEALYGASNDVNVGLQFMPMDFNSDIFRGARSRSSIDPANETLYYAITGQGSPVNAPIIYVAPSVNSAVALRFCYIPTLPLLTTDSFVPIPGEADNALVAWTAAFARSKEREDRSPDPNWIAVYGTEKQHLLQSLGLRQYQEPEFTEAMFEEYW